MPMTNIDPALRGHAPGLPGVLTSVAKGNPHQALEGDSSSSESDNSSEHGSRPGAEDSSSSDNDNDDMPDVGWAATGQARDAHPGMYLSGSEYLLMPL